MVWFWKQNPKFNLIQAIFTKVHVNASNNIWFSIIFYFLKKISIIFYCFRSIYDFNLDWFKYEHLIGNFFPGSTFLKKIVHSTIHFKINIQSTLFHFPPYMAPSEMTSSSIAVGAILLYFSFRFSFFLT